MREYLRFIENAPIFQGLTGDEILTMLNCLNAYVSTYKKNEFIYREGDQVSSIGLVLEGSVNVTEEDFWGNRSILSNVGPGNIFAESYACVSGETLRVSVYASEPTKVMFLDVSRVLVTCTSACVFHLRLIKNLLAVLARKNLSSTEKIGHITKRTTREKIMSYLSAESQRNASMQFDIPFNRQEFADFLAVDRSALSKELARLREEGVIGFKKNHFILY